jgi:hypothetical protein
MIDRTALLEDLKRLVTRVEADLLARSEDSQVPEIAEVLRGEYDRARAAKRTADTYGAWREDRITQAAVAWVLSCVFVRFLEDNDLISPPRVAGPGERLRQARDAHQHYFLSHPRDTDREYLLSIFDELAASPGTSGIFGAHNALREIPNWLSGDTAREVIQFFQKIDANTGLLIQDFSDAAWDARFLGDIYQDLSAYARSRYALLQTPHFIEQFLLDRTLEPAIDEFGLSDAFKMIDPACGSGHLVLGSFERLLDRWQRSEPATPVRELVRRTLGSVYGVDINPFAVAIARFRLLLVAMRACGIKRLVDAPDFRLNIECGDSLLHVPLVSGHQELFDRGSSSQEDDECDHAYASEDISKIKALLQRGQYHAVMANPPYITPKDPGLRDRYRKRFATCHMKYSLAVPFMEHIFKLCTAGGFTGQITANSFMKREFGKKLIEQFFPKTDLTHVIDTSGAYIPGHGTPTVILFGRRREPVDSTVRAVMGIRGEPSTPDNPAKGLVWTAITAQVDQPGSHSDFVSVADTPRPTFHAHPWSIGGGGAAELKEVLEETAGVTLQSVAKTAIGVVTLEDDVFSAMRRDWMRPSVEPYLLGGFVEGDQVRDWVLGDISSALIPYHFPSLEPVISEKAKKRLWPHRANLSNRKWFQKTQVQRGLHWWEYGTVSKTVGNTPLSIAFAEIATHNHFVLDRGGKVFKQTAPVIKLPTDATEDDHLALLGILNSSTACFWMKQVCHQKQMMGGDGIRITDKSKVPYAFNGTALANMPLPEAWAASEWRDHLIESTRQLDSLASEYASLAADVMLRSEDWSGALRKQWERFDARRRAIRSQQVYLQERIDFLVYRMFGLIDDDNLLGDPEPPSNLGLCAGERPFCLIAGHNSDGFAVPTAIPSDWPEAVKNVWRKRIAAIQTSDSLRLIETSMYKRRWIGRQGLFNHARTTDELKDAIQSFLLDRLERLFDFDGRMNDAVKPTATLPMGLVSIGGLADAVSRDPLFMEAAEVFVGAAGFDVTTLVGQLVENASVPLLPVLRYKATSLRKHEEWKEVWDLQRKEDAIDARTALPADNRNHLTTEQAADLKRREVGDILVPPKYTSADFAKSTYWALRGKLDTPKERFVSFPFVTGADGQTMILWAGLDHLQLAKAIGDFYGLVQTEIGGSDDPRLVPLLAALHELVPWVRQWHAGNDPVYGGEPAEFFEDFIRAEAAARGMTVAEVLNWQPPDRTRAKRAAKKAAKKTVKRATKKQADEAETP